MTHFKMIFRFLLSTLVYPNLRNVLSLLLMEIQSSQSFKEKKTKKQYHILRKFIFFFFKFIFEKNKAKSIISILWNTTHEWRAIWILFQSVECVDDLETNYPEKLPNTDVRLSLWDNKSWKVPSVHNDKCYFCFWLPRNDWYNFSIACWNLE